MQVMGVLPKYVTVLTMVPCLPLLHTFPALICHLPISDSKIGCTEAEQNFAFTLPKVDIVLNPCLLINPPKLTSLQV